MSAGRLCCFRYFSMVCREMNPLPPQSRRGKKQRKENQAAVRRAVISSPIPMKTIPESTPARAM